MSSKPAPAETNTTMLCVDHDAGDQESYFNDTVSGMRAAQTAFLKQAACATGHYLHPGGSDYLYRLTLRRIEAGSCKDDCTAIMYFDPDHESNTYKLVVLVDAARKIELRMSYVQAMTLDQVEQELTRKGGAR